MPENHLFEYAVVRIVPRVEREEFLNVGVILYCSGLQFLSSRFTLNEDRLHAFCEHTDLNEVREHLRAFELIARGSADGGPIAKLPIAERFRWLTATRSTIVQASKVHPGLCSDADQTLTHLHEQLVL